MVSGLYEPELAGYFCRIVRPDDHCLDVGANFGFFTCLLALLAHQGRVIGVEPDEHVHRLLHDNIFINGLQNRTAARRNAVCDTEKPLTLHRRVGRSGNTSIWQAPQDFTDFHLEPPVEPFTVPGTTVDALAAAMGGRVDVMKLDVEGAEPLVFQGIGAAVANNPGLQIVMEWSPGQMGFAGLSPAVLLDRVAELGLSVHTLDPGAPVLSRDTLLGLSFAHGVLITRQPR